MATRLSVTDKGLFLIEVDAQDKETSRREASLESNIVGVIDPRGVEILQVRYGVEPGLPSFNRVVEQRNGGITSFEYEFLFEPGDSAVDLAFTAPAVRLRMQGPEGDEREIDYNAQGRMIRHTVFEAGTFGTLPIETRWTYNADARVIREERPGGAATEYEYGRERFAALGGEPDSATAAERMRFGDLRKVIEHARPGATGPPQRIIEFDYHTEFGFITEQRGPFYANDLGVRIDDGPPFTCRMVYDDRANLVRVEYPDCTLADGSVQSDRSIEFVLDSRGRLVQRRIALSAGAALATAYEYPPDTDPACSQPLAEVLDPDGVALRRSFGYDAAGRTIRVEEASGQVVTRVFDHLGRNVLAETSSPVGGAPSRIVTTWAPQDVPARIVYNRVTEQLRCWWAGIRPKGAGFLPVAPLPGL